MASPSDYFSATRSVCVIVVDDNALIRNAILRTLQPMASAVGATSAEEAIALLGTRRIDVVLTDLDLGEGEDGGRLLERIRETLPRIRRVLMSGRHNLELRVDPPWQLFLPKPMTAEEVRAAVCPERAGRDRPGPDATIAERTTAARSE